MTFVAETADPFPFPGAITPGRTYREAVAEVARDAADLPKKGPIADLVTAIDAELTRLIAVGRPYEDTGRLHDHGIEALRLTGSIRGMIAIHQKAAGGGTTRRAQVRRDVLERAWHGIGTARFTWMR